MTGNGKRIISGQLRLGDSELSRFQLDDIIAKINSAQLLTGLNRIIFLPTRNQAINNRVLSHCRKLGIDVYLWYKILSENDIIPELDERSEDAWGRRGSGESGVWTRIFESEETYMFACPRNAKYNNLLFNRCAQMLGKFDGLYLDCIGFPLASLGLEAVFGCFCPDCRKQEPKLEEWRERVLEFREAAVSASDADLEKWGTFERLAAAFGLADFFHFRQESVRNLCSRYADLARKSGKGVGLDLLSPSLAFMGGHNYHKLGGVADWTKPRIYFRVFGPSSLPVEFYSLTMGMIAWGKRYTIPGVLRFIERSTGLKMPTNVHSLAQNYLPDHTYVTELNKAKSLAACPLHLGFECSLHPDYNTGVSEESLKTFLSYSTGSAGLVLTWNLLYVPDNFLRVIGRNL